MSDPVGNHNLNPAQFGMSDSEAREIQGKALGAHLWDGVQNIFGNIKVQRQSSAYDTLRAQFPSHEIHHDADDEPYVRERQGKWELRHFNAPIAEVHHSKHGPQDIIRWGSGDEHLSVRPEHLKQELRNWVKDYSADYEGHM